MQEDPRKIIKQTEEWTLYEEGLESWAVNVEFPMEALKGANGSLKLTIPADVWSILRQGNHSKAPYYRMNTQQLRKLAEQWVERRLIDYNKAKGGQFEQDVYLKGCLVADLDAPSEKQVEDFIAFYTPPNKPAVASEFYDQSEEDPDLVYSIYPYLESDDEVVGDMKRGAHCYFCGTKLSRMNGDELGSCYECDKCPPVTHWRWNEDTEFLQLYVAGERCPYCGLQVPESTEVSADLKELTQIRTEEPKAISTTTKSVRKTGKPVTVNDVWWGSVVEWCRAHNDHDARGGYSYHNCSKELARMQSKGELDVIWHNRDRIPGTKELIATVSA